MATNRRNSRQVVRSALREISMAIRNNIWIVTSPKSAREKMLCRRGLLLIARTLIEKPADEYQSKKRGLAGRFRTFPKSQNVQFQALFLGHYWRTFLSEVETLKHFMLVSLLHRFN